MDSNRNSSSEVSETMWLDSMELNRYLGGKAMTDTMWKCDQVRAGQLYNRVMFDTREEAERFRASSAAFRCDGEDRANGMPRRSSRRARRN